MASRHRDTTKPRSVSHTLSRRQFCIVACAGILASLTLVSTHTLSRLRGVTRPHGNASKWSRRHHLLEPSRTVWGLPYYLALRGFVWADASAKTPTWQRRHSLRACLPDQARGASEGRRRHAVAVEALAPPDAGSSRRDSCRDSRRNSVHECPETAPRGHFGRSVYTPASPRSLERSSRSPTVYTNAPKRHREAISTDLCTLLRRRTGGEAHVASAVRPTPSGR